MILAHVIVPAEIFTKSDFGNWGKQIVLKDIEHELLSWCWWV